MQACGYILIGPVSTSFDSGGCSNSIVKWPIRLGGRRFTASATTNGRRNNHYAVLGISSDASSTEIKKAYRLLALKYHPDVNKELGANEAFKSIRLAYDILIDETRRSQYDQVLQYQESVGKPLVDDWIISSKSEEELGFNRWAYVRRKMWSGKYFWEEYHSNRERQSPHDDDGKASEVETLDEERGSFVEVLKSALLSLFLMQTVGIQLSLAFSSLMALVDQKLDAGYKFGYIFAWILGGRGGILLTMFLSFASWVCGKTSSSIVALVVVAMWFGSNLARYAPFPQGALLTLLYMSIKLQVDLN